MTIPNVSSGAVVATSWGNAVADKLNLFDDAAQSFTPNITGTGGNNPALGTTGSATGHYVLLGPICILWERFFFDGSGITTGAGVYEFSLPSGILIANLVTDPSPGTGTYVGVGHVRDNSATTSGSAPGTGVYARSSTLLRMSYATGAVVGAGAPIATLATGDAFSLVAVFPWQAA